MSAPLIVIAAGGTGGHMFPAQALAEALLAKGWRVVLSTDARGARYTDGFPKAVQIEQVSASTFARGGLGAKLATPFKLMSGVLASMKRFRADQPAIVVGFGGYPSFPAIAAAWILRLPRAIHEQNGILGRVNKVFAKRVHAVACGTWPTQVPAGARAENVGNPVRRAIHEKAGSPYIPPGNTPMSVLVIGGSQGARILSDVVPPALAALPLEVLSQLRISHQARAEDGVRVTDFYRDHAINADVQAFFDDIPDRMSQAQLVISRAGASSVADISVIGRPSILVPFAAATADHQTANARGLEEANAAVVISESDLSVERLRDAVQSIMLAPDRAMAMARAALSEGKPDATGALVGLVETLARRPA